jgi:hypothetical protein
MHKIGKTKSFILTMIDYLRIILLLKIIIILNMDKYILNINSNTTE